ncbi:hypothetical protein A7982_12103 [Minicystis rosea]|nr:hypothetical protein A7982_12103 [Minicystis rosea]
MSAPEAKKDWRTISSGVISLAAHAGGFVAVELVAPVALGAPRLDRPVSFTGTQAVAHVVVPCPDLPANTMWTVEWYLPSRKEPIMGPTTKIEGGAVKAILDLATGGEALGAFLEAPQSLRLRLTPDHPHVHSSEPNVPSHCVELAVDFPHPLRLSLDGHVFSQSESLTGAHVGKRIALSLSRSGWRAAVRLRVDTPGEQDVVLPFTPGHDGATWVLGMSGGGDLQLPDPTSGTLTFNLVLEVSAGEDGPWSLLSTSTLAVPAPSLASLDIEIAPGAERMITRAEPESWLEEIVADRHVYAVGRFDGFAEGFDPPFSLELWMARRTSMDANAAVVIQPLTRRRVDIGALRNGTFRAAVDALNHEMDALQYREATPFVVLRASEADPLPSIQHCFSFSLEAVAFSDEDVWRRGDVLGICSRGVTQGMHLVRQPVMGAVSIAVEKEALALYCGVLGPADAWKAAKPHFILQAGETKTQKDAAVVELPNSEKRRLRAEIPLNALGPFAGKAAALRVELGAKGSIYVPPNAGQLAPPVIAPRLGPVEWDRDDAGHTRFLCRTAFFPKGSQSLVATLSVAGAPPFGAVTYAIKGGRVDDEGLVFFPAEADAARCNEALANNTLSVSVSLPAPRTALYDVPALTVPVWTGTPLPRAR